MEVPKRRRGRVRSGRIALMGALAAAGVMAFGVSSAQAVTVPFNATFDDGGLDVGGLTFDILDPPNTATMAGDIDPATGDFTVPTDGFTFPTFSGDALPGVPLSVDFSAVDPITGNLNQGTGALTTDPSGYEAVVTGLGGVCTYAINEAFSTAGGSPFSGDPFSVVTGDPTSISNGVMQTSWASIAPDLSLPCVTTASLINTIVGGAGGLAIGNGADITPAAAGGGSTPAAPAAPVKKKKCKKKHKRSASSAKKKKCKKKK
jgi:hypothetical protein